MEASHSGFCYNGILITRCSLICAGSCSCFVTFFFHMLAGSFGLLILLSGSILLFSKKWALGWHCGIIDQDTAYNANLLRKCQFPSWLHSFHSGSLLMAWKGDRRWRKCVGLYFHVGSPGEIPSCSLWPDPVLFVAAVWRVISWWKVSPALPLSLYDPFK